MPLIALVLTLGLSLVSVASPPGSEEVQRIQTVGAVDLDRYAGTWFEIARYPNRFQRDCTGDVTATYSRRDDGRIDVLNRCQTEEGEISAHGIARVTDPGSNATLKVRFAPGFLSFLPFVWGDYWVIGLADDYSWAVVGSPDRKYLWILSRTASLDEESYAAAVAAADRNGFDVTRLVKTSQSTTGRDTP
jgi:apolipoprotein D and lipocalin family protein